MPLIDFDERLIFGILEIDIQHKKWIDLINKLDYEIENKKVTVYSVKKILDELLDYAKSHFALEEKYFKSFDYKTASEHIEEHVKFIKMVEDIKAQYIPGTSKLAPDILNFMVDWVINHINKTDREYKDLFIGCGQKYTVLNYQNILDGKK